MFSMSGFSMKRKFFFLTLFLLLIYVSTTSAQDSYKISVEIDGFTNDTLLLGYQYADKQYIKDTVTIIDGVFTFQGNEALDCGMYLLIMPPENKYFQMIIDDVDQEFSVKTSVENPVKDIKIEGSEENKRFYDYLKFIGEQSPKAQAINEKLKSNQDAGKDSKQLQKDLEKLNSSVAKYQLDLIEKNPSSMTARIVKTSREIDVPVFESTDKGKRARFVYLREHWFDNTDLSDPCLIRTSLIHNKVMSFVEKLTVQHPDSIANSIDIVIEKASGNEETKRHWLSTFLNKYANSKVIGMDAIYVHLVMNYYAKGQTPWVEDEKLLEIVDNASKTEPLLIGKIAPEIEIPLLDVNATAAAAKVEEDESKKFVLGEKVSLHNLDSPYKILFMWAPDCGHCKKSMPKMIAFYDKFKDKGVALYAICHQNYKSTPECADFILERPEMLNWINVTDPYFRSRYQTLYNVKSTPQIYVLDDKNEILMKRLGAAQLEEVMNELFKREENK